MSQIYIITGTSKGIGKNLALYYLSKGHTIVGCSRSLSTIEHQDYRHYTLDVSDESAVVKMVRSTKKEFKRVDVLINNAGVASMNHFLTTSMSSVQNIFATNFFGTFLFSREVAKIMMKQKYGRIVNFTTVAAALRLEGEAIYGASKAAVENLTQTTAKELASFNITVNAIGPTPVETDLIKSVPKEKIKALLEKQTLKRFGVVEDIKNVIDFYISDKSDFVTGQVLYLGGVNS